MFKKNLAVGLGGALLVGAFVSASVTPAAAAEDWYVNFSAGGTSTQDSDVNVPLIAPIVLETTQDRGPIVLGAIGKRFPSGLRVEGELSYRKNDFEDIKATGTTTVSGVTITGTNVPVALTGDVTSFGFMANVAYDFMKDDKFHPYVLAGVGGTKISVNDATVGGLLLADDDDFVLAYQIGVGVNYDFTDNMALGISYRFFGASDADLTASDGTTNFDIEYLNHSIMAGLTYKF